MTLDAVPTKTASYVAQELAALNRAHLRGETVNELEQCTLLARLIGARIDKPKDVLALVTVARTLVGARCTPELYRDEPGRYVAEASVWQLLDRVVAALEIVAAVPAHTYTGTTEALH